MLNKTQADAIADALTSAALARRDEELDARAPAVPFVYRTGALLRLPPREQARLLSRARRSAFAGWHPACLMACWFGVTAMALWLFLHDRPVSPSAWLLLSAFLIVAVQLRMLLVRLRLQELLLGHFAAAPGHDI